MTLWSLKTYRYNCSKTKSYWIQKRFLPLFIFLSDLGLQVACFLIKWSTYKIALGWTRWGDAQRGQKKIMYKGHLMWLHKRLAKFGKMCNWLFLLNWNSGGRIWRSHAMWVESRKVCMTLCSLETYE